ncbi:2-C-methyl-D-erythritol 2,4-cyclodiphosphate synthase [Acidobacteriota bacterium]
MRVGIGYDIHRLVDGRDLYLGGIKISFPKGLLGHSDGDCLIHAIADALLGALGEGDIGQQFPDTEDKFQGIRSFELLQQIMHMMNDKKARIDNIDSIIVAEQPRLVPHVPAMKEVLCPILNIEEAALGIKAKTHEGLGPLGHGEAIAAWASVLITLEES